MNQTQGIAPILGQKKGGKKERLFKLSLPISVTGSDAGGQEFSEKSKLIAISSERASFLLNSKVLVGSILNLCLEIPKTLILGRSLNMSLSGRVVLVQAEPNLNRPVITLQLQRSYKIRPVSLS